MLWTILVILLVLWLLGFLGHVGGGMIHLLLVIAAIVLVINLVSGRRTVLGNLGRAQQTTAAPLLIGLPARAAKQGWGSASAN
jgi:hypothetical protein